MNNHITNWMGTLLKLDGNTLEVTSPPVYFTTNCEALTIWLFNSSPWKIPIFKNGKPW